MVMSTIFLSFFLFSPVALAGKNCEMKEKRLLEQLEKAKSFDNTGRIRGLERALNNVRTYCTDQSEKFDMQK